MARDEHVYDLVDFTVWYDGALGLRRWLEAPPVAEVQDEREIALARMLTVGAAASRCLWRGLRRGRACLWRP